MSKKRKTRKQKEQAHLRHEAQVQHVHIDTPTYSVDGLKTELIKKPSITVSNKLEAQSDKAYLKKDIMAITAASGIIAALEVLLFTLLSAGVIRFNFLGY